MYVLNPYFKVKLGPPSSIDLLLDGKEVFFPHPNYIRFLKPFEAGGTKKQLKEKISTLCNETYIAEDIVNFFISNNVLILEKDKNSYDLDGVKHWIERHWESALELHLKTQFLDYADDQDPNIRNDKDAYDFNIDFWKTYKNQAIIKLPSPQDYPKRSLEDILLSRRTGKINIGKQLDIKTFSTIMGNVNKYGRDIRINAESIYKDQPSVLLDSAFTALETYIAIYNVEDIKPGIYFYDMKKHNLCLVQSGDFRDEIGKFCIGQRYAGMGACSFLITSVWERYMKRYTHSRAYRNLLINTAELAHKYILAATSFRLGNFLTPALRDEMSVNLIKEPQSKESILYVVTIG